MKHATIIFILLFSFFAFAGLDDSVPNLQKPRYLVFTSGQPTDLGFRQLSGMGIQTVINVLPEKECLVGEEDMVAANHMYYFQLPFDPENLNTQTVERFAKLMASVQKPVLIHCSTGNHVGGLWFAYRVLYDNANLALALKEARQIGMRPAMEDLVFEWVVNQTMVAGK